MSNLRSDIGKFTAIKKEKVEYIYLMPATTFYACFKHFHQVIYTIILSYV